MAIASVTLPYPDFHIGDVIDPEEFDFNNEEIKNKANLVISVLNQITDSIVDGTSGADAISLTAITPFVSTKLQAYLEEVIAKIKNTTLTTSGAEFVGSASITGVTGGTVYAQLNSIKGLIDAITTANWVTTTRIVDSAVTTAKIADSNVTAIKIGADAVTTVKILDANVTLNKLASNSVDASKIVDLSVGTAELGATVVTQAKLALLSVGTAQLIDANVTTAKLATNAVVTVNITDANVTNAKLASNAVGTTNIIDANVTANKIASGAVTAVKMDINSVGTTNIIDANVTNAKMASNSVGSSNIIADAVTTVKILDANVTANKILDGAVTLNKIPDGTITSTKCVTGTFDTRYYTKAQVDSAISGATSTAVVSSGASLPAGTTVGQEFFLTTTGHLNIWDGTVWQDTADQTFTADQAIATAFSNTGKVSQMFSWFAKAMKSHSGGTNWYDVPSATINDLSTNKADKNSPTFTGVPLTTTPTAGDNSFKIASTAYVVTAMVPFATLASPNLTGTPTVPTGAFDLNTTQIANTAWVIGQASSTTPIVDGSGTVGTSLKWARADHIHPTNTTLATKASPALTGIPTAPTAVQTTNNTQIATTAYVDGKYMYDNDVVTFISTFPSGAWMGETALATMAVSVSNSDLLYMSSSGYNKAQSNAIATTKVKAICVDAGTGSRKILKRGYLKNTTWSWTPGAELYLSPTTAGLLVATAPSTVGQFVQVVGYAESATVIYFNPDPTYIEV